MTPGSPVLNRTILLNTSLPLKMLVLLFILNVESSLFLEASFTVQCVFSNTVSSYNLEIIFSFILINLLNKYAKVSSALYKKYVHTTDDTSNNKTKFDKNM